MPSAIDVTVPIFGTPTTASERANWTAAKGEIEALQSGYAPLNNANLTGTPTAPTPPPGDNDSSIATTAFVQAAVVSSTTGVASFNTRTGSIVLNTPDITGAGGAPLASPAFTGTPTAPTQPSTDNSTRLANTAYVTAKMGSVPTPATTNPQMDGAATPGATTTYARGDHRHPTDTSRAPLDAPSFTTQALVNGNLYCTGVSYINPANGWEWASYREASSGDHIQIHRAGWYDRWASATGLRTWVVNNAVGMTLDIGQNLSVAGGVVAGGAVSAGAGYNLSQASAGGLWAADGSNVYMRFSGAWGWTWSRTTGRLYFLNGSGTSLMEISEGGAGIRFPQLSGNLFGWNWDGYGVGMIVDGGSQGYAIRSPSGSGITGVYQIGLNGSVSQVYSWYATGVVVAWNYFPSDRRLKKNIEPSTFDAIGALNQLQVRSFDMTVPIPGAVEMHWDCGLVADEVKEVMPIAYAPATVDGSYEMIRELPLITTLVRAVQQLTELNDDLTARIAALEARAA